MEDRDTILSYWLFYFMFQLYVNVLHECIVSAADVDMSFAILVEPSGRTRKQGAPVQDGMSVILYVISKMLIRGKEGERDTLYIFHGLIC